MIAAAVICFVTEARRKRVRGSIGARVRSSRTPYPRSKTVRPFLRTSTAKPGSPSATKPFKSADVAASRSMAGAAPAKRRRTRASMRGSSHPLMAPVCLLLVLSAVYLFALLAMGLLVAAPPVASPREQVLRTARHPGLRWPDLADLA